MTIMCWTSCVTPRSEADIESLYSVSTQETRQCMVETCKGYCKQNMQTAHGQELIPGEFQSVRKYEHGLGQDETARGGL